MLFLGVRVGSRPFGDASDYYIDYFCYTPLVSLFEVILGFVSPFFVPLLGPNVRPIVICLIVLLHVNISSKSSILDKFL